MSIMGRSKNVKGNVERNYVGNVGEGSRPSEESQRAQQNLEYEKRVEAQVIQRFLALPEQQAGMRYSLSEMGKALRTLADEQEGMLKTLQSVSRQVHSLEDSEDNRDTVEADRASKLSRHCESIEDSLAAITREISDEQYKARFVEPLANQVIAILDMVRDMREHETISEDANEAISAALVQLLETYGLETIPIEAGDNFDAKTSRPSEVKWVTAPGLNGLVAEVVRNGFRWRNSGDLIRHAVVVVNRSA